jgi:hypothetical protein
MFIYLSTNCEACHCVKFSSLSSLSLFYIHIFSSKTVLTLNLHSSFYSTHDKL